VFDSRARLDLEHVRYISDDHIDISDLPYDPLFWPRYKTLCLNMVAASACQLRRLAAAFTILEKVLAHRMTWGLEAAISQHFVVDRNELQKPPLSGR
jgi:hypothetical protein